MGLPPNSSMLSVSTIKTILRLTISLLLFYDDDNDGDDDKYDHIILQLKTFKYILSEDRILFLQLLTETSFRGLQVLFENFWISRFHFGFIFEKNVNLFWIIYVSFFPNLESYYNLQRGFEKISVQGGPHSDILMYLF